MSNESPATRSGQGRVALGRLVPIAPVPIDPARHPETLFDHYSVEGFAAGRPEVVTGAVLGSAKQRVEPADVLLSRIVSQPRRAWVVGPSQGRTQAASNEWIVLRSPRVDPGYLRHLLVSNRFHVRFMAGVKAGGKVQRVQPRQVAAIEIALPPLPRQQRIAQVLDAANALRARRRAMIAVLDALPRSMFDEMFDDLFVRRAGARRASMLDWLAAAPLIGTAAVPARDGDWHMLRPVDFRQGRLDPTGGIPVALPPSRVESHALADGDLLLVRNAGPKAPPGLCDVVDRCAGRWTWDSRLIRLRVDRSQAEPAFVRHVFLSPGGRALLAGVSRRSSTGSSIDPRALAALRIALPPIERQREFVSRLDAIAKLGATSLRSAAGLDALIGTLRDRAFQGALDPV